MCGADLDPSRWDTGPTVGNRIGSALNALSFGGIPGWLVWLAIGFVIVWLSL